MGQTWNWSQATAATDILLPHITSSIIHTRLYVVCLGGGRGVVLWGGGGRRSADWQSICPAVTTRIYRCARHHKTTAPAAPTTTFSPHELMDLEALGVNCIFCHIRGIYKLNWLFIGFSISESHTTAFKTLGKQTKHSDRCVGGRIGAHGYRMEHSCWWWLRAHCGCATVNWKCWRQTLEINNMYILPLKGWLPGGKG